METPPKMFKGNPIEQNEEGKQEIKKLERSEVKARLKEEALHTPLPLRQRLYNASWWLMVGILAIIILPAVFDWTFYILRNQDTIKFMRENPELTRSLKDRFESIMTEDKCTVYKAITKKDDCVGIQ